jgi:DNA-binding winged helix-turn-helix (wHTH) protein/TolB-like protein
MNLQTQSRQIELAREAPFTLGLAEVRPATREVVAGELREVLEPRVMQVLVALAQRRGEVVSRDELTIACWNGRVVGDDAINRCIGAVRKLAANFGGFALETIPRVGYRLLDMPQSAGAAETSAAEPPAVAAPGYWLAVKARWPLLTALAAFFLIAAGFAAWLQWSAAKQDVAPAKFSIAVLPFTPLSGDRDAERLGDAIAASVADMLSRVGRDVVSPAESLQFRGAAKARAAKALHAALVIDGELRRERDTLVVAIRLIDVNDGTTVRADTFAWPAAQADTLPEYVATEIANYGWFILPNNGPKPQWNPRVMAGGLKVVNLLTLRRDNNRRDPPGAYGLALEIADSAPDNAMAQMLLGWTAAQLIPDAPLFVRANLAREARRSADRAIRLDPYYGDPYAVLSLATPMFDWAAREDYLRRGMDIQPISIAYMDLTDFLQNAGRFGEAGRMAEDAYDRDPYLATAAIKAINSRLWLGQWDAALSLLAHERGHHPNSDWFAAKTFEAMAFRGAFAAAEALLKEADTAALLEPGVRPRIYSHTLAALRHRRPADIQAVADDCADVTRSSLAFRRTCLLALAALGRLNEAFRLAEDLYPDQRGATADEIERKWLPTGRFATAYLLIPATAKLRADPRFRAVAERVGLLQYWKASKHPPDFCATEKAPVCALLKAA